MLTQIHCQYCGRTMQGMEGGAQLRCPNCSARPRSHDGNSSNSLPLSDLVSRPTQLAASGPFRINLLVNLVKPALIAVVGDLVCFGLYALMPAWEQFLNSQLTMTDKEAQRLAESRFALVVLALLALPWLVFFIATIVTMVGSAFVASSTSRRLVRLTVPRIAMAILIGLVASAVSLLFTHTIYAAEPSVAVDVHRYLLACGVPLLAGLSARTVNQPTNVSTRKGGTDAVHN